MDLLQESVKNNNNNKKEKTQAQKIVLVLLIISIILCVIVALLIVYLSSQDKVMPYSIMVNGKNIDLNDLQVMSTDKGQKYVAIKALTNTLGYNYYNGEFNVADEGKNKGYVNTQKNIVQFIADTNKIYKTTETSNNDYEYYTLENNILEYEGNIYIALEDLPVALNVILNYSIANNQTSIETPEYWIEQRTKKFEENNIIISEEPENLRALSYGYLIISENEKYGVIDLNGNEIIGNKYASITYFEYKKKFVVSDIQNKFGIITRSGLADIDLQYDSLEIINYNPLLYKVKRLDKYGVIREDGSIIGEIEYDSIGYPEKKAEEINYTLIVPYLNENIPQSLVVYSEKKYGLIEIETGREIIPCMLEGIFSKKEDNSVFYAELAKKIYSLEECIENYYKLTSAIR